MATPDDGIVWLTVEETCERWDIAYVTLYKRIRQGFVTGVKRGRQLYFDAARIDWLARFSMPTDKAAASAGVGWDELTYWADYNLVPALDIDGRYLFAPEDIAVLRLLLKEKIVRITEATRLYGLSLHTLRNTADRGLLHTLRFASYYYVLREELEGLTLTIKGYTVTQTAQRLGLSIPQVLYKAGKGELRYTRTPGGHRRFNEANIRMYEAKRDAARDRHTAKKRTREP